MNGLNAQMQECATTTQESASASQDILVKHVIVVSDSTGATAFL